MGFKLPQALRKYSTTLYVATTYLATAALIQLAEATSSENNETPFTLNINGYRSNNCPL